MSVNEIIDLLVQKALEKEIALKELFKLTKEQKHFIEEGDIRQVDNIVGKKQELIHDINQIDIAFLYSYKMLKRKLDIQTLEEIDHKQYPTLKELKSLTENLMNLLSEIDLLDKLNHKNLNANFEALKEEMKKITDQKKGTKAISSYQQRYVGTEGAFIDSKVMDDRTKK